MQHNPFNQCLGRIPLTKMLSQIVGKMEYLKDRFLSLLWGVNDDAACCCNLMTARMSSHFTVN